MATLTASAAAAGVQPIACNGINVVHGRYALAANLSAGDVIQLVKVPAGAHIVGGRVSFNMSGTLAGITIGDDLDTDRFTSSASFSATNTWFNTTTQDYSYSAANTIDAKVHSVTSASATGTIEVMVMYTYLQDSY